MPRYSQTISANLPAVEDNNGSEPRNSSDSEWSSRELRILLDLLIGYAENNWPKDIVSQLKNRSIDDINAKIKEIKQLALRKRIERYCKTGIKSSKSARTYESNQCKTVRNWLDASKLITNGKYRIEDATIPALSDYLSTEIKCRPVSETTRRIFNILDGVAPFSGVYDYSFVYRTFHKMLRGKEMSSLMRPEMLAVLCVYEGLRKLVYQREYDDRCAALSTMFNDIKMRKLDAFDVSSLRNIDDLVSIQVDPLNLQQPSLDIKFSADINMSNINICLN